MALFLWYSLLSNSSNTPITPNLPDPRNSPRCVQTIDISHGEREASFLRFRLASFRSSIITNLLSPLNMNLSKDMA